MPDDLLFTYYEREIAFLHSKSSDFARRYPRVARDLMLSDQGSEDPHIRRLIHSVALMIARVNMRLGDDYGGFAENLLDALYPQYNRPRPSCAIARFDRRPPKWGDRGIRSATSMALGRPVTFSALFAPRTADGDVVSVAFEPTAHFELGDGTCTSGSCVTLRFDQPLPATTRLYIHGEPALIAQVRDALSFGKAHVVVAKQGGGYVRGGQVAWVGPEAFDGGLLDPDGAHPGYGLLRELFAFPDRFSFFDLRLPEEAVGSTSEVGVVFTGDTDGATVSALARLAPSNVLTRCAPVSNVYPTTMTLTSEGGTRSSFVATENGSTIVAIQSVHSLDRDRKDQAPIPRYFHGRRPDPDYRGCFWVAHPGGAIRSDRAARGPFRLMLVDDEERPFSEVSSLSVQAYGCDGEVATSLLGGTSLSTLRASSTGDVIGQLITTPSAFLPASHRREASWRLLSHLRLSHSSLLGPDATVLRDFLSLHAPDDAAIRRSINGLKGVSHRPINHWLPGSFPPTLVRGTEITLMLDESAFVGLGLHAWVRVLDRFFADYAHINSFTQLIVRSILTGKEVHRCQPNTGTGPLI